MPMEPTDETPGLSRVIYSTRWLTGIAVVFSLLGAVFMFVVGAVSTVQSIGTYFGGGKEDALSDEAALKATTEIVGSLDEFLLALVLLIFGYGVYRLFISEDRSEGPDWLAINSVTDLKIKLLETIATILAVVFLKAVLSNEVGSEFQWEELVLPIAVALFALTTWIIRKAH